MMDKDIGRKTIRQHEKQIQILRDSVIGLAQLMLAMARSMSEEANELKRKMARKDEHEENMLVVGRATTARFKAVIDERNEARRHACRLMWERDEARGGRDVYELSNYDHQQEIVRLEATLERWNTEGAETIGLFEAYRDELWDGRAEARHWAGRMMRQRDEAREWRDKYKLANSIYEDDCRNFREQIAVLRSALAGLKSALMNHGYDEYEIASMGYEVDRAGEADGD